jgi:uncharacterized membrane protein YdjX (TVP38/TMEM64 family)
MHNKGGRIFLLLVASFLIGTFFAFDLGRFLTLASLQEQKQHLLSLYDTQPVVTAGLYVLAYILMAALSLPGAMFGVSLGTVLVSVASTTGATLAFLASRYLMGRSIQTRFADKLTTINEGVQKEGAFYLFSLRLIPVFPFFMVNLVMGLTPIPVRTFFWVSQLGMLPGTIVYVNAGTQLSQLQSLKGVLSPTLLLSFAAICRSCPKSCYNGHRIGRVEFDSFPPIAKRPRKGVFRHGWNGAEKS